MKKGEAGNRTEVPTTFPQITTASEEQPLYSKTDPSSSSFMPVFRLSSIRRHIEQWDENFTTTHCKYPVLLSRQWTLRGSDMKTMWNRTEDRCKSENWLSTWKYTNKQKKDSKAKTRVLPLILACLKDSRLGVRSGKQRYSLSIPQIMSPLAGPPDVL